MRWDNFSKFLVLVVAIIAAFAFLVKPLSSTVKQGLDLQGGTHVVLQAVETPDAPPLCHLEERHLQLHAFALRG